MLFCRRTETGGGKIPIKKAGSWGQEKINIFLSVLCCGPEVMMKKVIEICKEKQVKVYVSMEKHMACGVGACLVCTCKTKDGNKRTCKDGPVFDGYYVEL